MNGKTDEAQRTEQQKNILKWLMSLFQKDGKPGKWSLWIGALGAVVLLLGGLFTDGKDAETEKISSSISGVSAAEEYEQALEVRLEQLLSHVEGVGEVSVMVTLESTERVVYAQTVQKSSDMTQTQQNGGSERSSYTAEYVLIENDGGDEQALTETTLQPTIKGVAVVCTGAQELYVVSRITELVSTVLGIPSNRICVTN